MLKRPVTSDSCVVGERTDNRGGIVDSSMGGKGISRVHAAATRLASSAPAVPTSLWAGYGVGAPPARALPNPLGDGAFSMIHFGGLTMLAAQTSPTNIFAPASTPAHSIHELYLFVLAVTGVIFLVVFGMLTYAAVKYRSRPGDKGEPTQIYGSDQLELAWTVIPVLIVMVLFLSSARVIHALAGRAEAAGGDRGNGRRSSILVGVPLSAVRIRDGE